jgi:hypothetical protein
MDAAWGGLVTGFEHSDGLVQLGEIRTTLLHPAGCPPGDYVALSAVLRGYDHPSAATMKRRALDGTLVTAQPGGPNTMRDAEVAEIRPGVYEPVWRT